MRGDMPTLDWAANASGAPCAMQVLDAVLGGIQVVHMADRRQVQAPRSRRRCQQERCLVVPEGMQRLTDRRRQMLRN